ncbi:substrate-binding domain-containing protein [Carboxylicivirga sp. M1479]|uniref:substrate-binding domain-containing protein n=1 Tax=Carboxylicivirga sp. M1479 TaxID=2594476 RepID=UPI00163D57D8|nr:substrate-binding domain-containing protein [Carboxylicivirga sp. M1479]
MPIFITVIVLIIFNACQSDEAIKLGFLYSTSNTERYVKEAGFFKEYVENNGAQVLVEHGEGDEAIQYQKAIAMFDEGIDGLALIAVNANTAAAIVREGKERGVKVIAHNRLVTNCDLDFFVSGDNTAIGKMMVDEIIKAKPSGTAVILGGDKYDRNAVGMGIAINEYLKPHIQSGNIEVLYETYIEDWSIDNAAFELDQVISNTGEVPDIIFAGYDGMAQGCIQVLEKHGVEKPVYITGQDATLEGVRNIVAGKQQMTAYHPSKETAYKSAEVLMMLVNNDSGLKSMHSGFVNNGQKDVPNVRVSSIAITKDNIDKVLIQETASYTRDEVYN